MEETNRGGRPRITNKKKKKDINLKVRIDGYMNDRLEAYCERHGLIRTTVVRMALNELFKREGVEL